MNDLAIEAINELIERKLAKANHITTIESENGLTLLIAKRGVSIEWQVENGIVTYKKCGEAAAFNFDEFFAEWGVEHTEWA